MAVRLAQNLPPNLSWKTKETAEMNERVTERGTTRVSDIEVKQTDSGKQMCFSHLVRCVALEAANVQRGDEGHILKTVLHTHCFGSFVLKITSQFHHLSPLISTDSPGVCS